MLQEDGSIQNFLRKHQPNEKDPYGIDKEAMDNYVKVSAYVFVILWQRAKFGFACNHDQIFTKRHLV